MGISPGPFLKMRKYSYDFEKEKLRLIIDEVFINLQAKYKSFRQIKSVESYWKDEDNFIIDINYKYMLFSGSLNFQMSISENTIHVTDNLKGYEAGLVKLVTGQTIDDIVEKQVNITAVEYNVNPPVPYS